MQQSRLRRRIAWEAARLLYLRHESDLSQAKLRAGRSLCGGPPRPNDLPTDREVRRQLEALANSHDEQLHRQALQAARQEILLVMRAVSNYHPLLVESSLRAHIRRAAPVALHVYAQRRDDVLAALSEADISAEVIQKQVLRNGRQRILQRVLTATQPPCELTVYPPAMAGRAVRGKRSGKPLRRSTTAQLERQLERLPEEFFAESLTDQVPQAAPVQDRFVLFQALLAPLEQVQQSPLRHPEGDCLYHSLQVFERARDELPYDEEFLLAALLHDVGKAIDPADHVAAGLAALGEAITPRTAWLIEHHPQGHALREGTLGVRAKRRLEAAESFEELLLLAECDRAGRQVGVRVEDTTAALDYIRQLSEMCGE